MVPLIISILLIGAAVIWLLGRVTRAAGLTDAAGQAIALTIISIGAVLAASERWSELLGARESAEQVLTLAREIGLTGLFFIAGVRVRLDELRASLRVSMAVATPVLLLFGIAALALSVAAGADWSAAPVIAACFTASSIWLPSHLAGEAGDKQSGVSGSAMAAAPVLAAGSMLAIHLLGAFHAVPARVGSRWVYAIVAAYEIVKVAVFFSFALFVATRFIAGAAKTSARVSDVRVATGYLLMAVLLFALGRALVGELGALAWSFIAGAVFARSEIGKRMTGYRPAAGGVFLSLAFLPMFLDPHGRAVTRLPMLLGAIIAALIVKFALSAMAARIAGCSTQDARLAAASTLAPGEVAAALLAFALTRWPIGGPAYFAVLIFALLSMISAPFAWKSARREGRNETEHLGVDGAQPERKSRRGGKAGRASNKKATLYVMTAAAALLSLSGTALSQAASQSAPDDPPARAIRIVE